MKNKYSSDNEWPTGNKEIKANHWFYHTATFHALFEMFIATEVT